MSNNTTSNDWLNFMWTLHNKVRNGKGIKLTGLAALNEINNFLLIFFISKKFKDYGIDEKYSFFTMYENFCNPTLKDNNKDNKLYKQLHEYYCGPSNNNCVLRILLDNNIIKKYLKNNVITICSLTENNETGRTIQDIFIYMYDHFNNIAKQCKPEKEIKALTLDDFGFDAFGDAYERFKQQSCEDSGKTTGQHFTPTILKEYIINELKIKDTEIFYEPCAGSGGFIHVAMKYIKNNKGNYKKFVKNLYANECNGEIYKPLSINMLIHDIPIENINKQDSLELKFCEQMLNKIDVIGTNPPFGAGDKADSDKYWGPLLTGKNVIKNAMAQFIIHMYHSLKIGGRCGTISDRGIINNGTDGKNSWETKLRKFILENTNLYKIVLLPSDTFSYTTFSTCILFFIKGTTTENVEFRELKFKESNINGLKTKNIESDILLGNVNIKEIKEKNYSLKYDDYIKEQVIKEEINNDTYIKLGDVCEIKNGKYNSNDMNNSGKYPFYSCVSNNPIGTHSEYSFDYENYILFIGSGGSQNNVCGPTIGMGKTYIVNGKTACRSNVYALIMKNINIKYIYYYLNINKYNICKNAKFSANLGVISLSTLKNILVPNLSIEHQEEIVKFLNKQFENYNINNIKKDIPIFKFLINKQYDMAAELLHIVYRQMAAELLHIVYRQMAAELECENIKKDIKAIFKLNVYNLNAEIKKLGDIVEIKNYKPIKIENSNNTGKYPFYNCSILGHLWSDEYQYEDDVLLMNKVNGSGKCIIYHNNGKFSIAANMLIFKTSNNKFFEKLLNYNSSLISKQFKGGDKKALNLQDFKNIKFSIPPLEIQEEIINKIEKLNEHNSHYESYSNMLKTEIDNIMEIIDNMTILSNNKDESDNNESDNNESDNNESDNNESDNNESDNNRSDEESDNDKSDNNESDNNESDEESDNDIQEIEYKNKLYHLIDDKIYNINEDGKTGKLFANYINNKIKKI